MAKDRIIEVPLPKVIHNYYSHDLNLGKMPVIERRHWLGKHIVSIMSYMPLRPKDLPVDEITRIQEDYETYAMELTFPICIPYMMNHHLMAISDAMQSVFEISLMNFCRGRFTYIPSYYAAIDDFFTRYGLGDVDVDKDYYRRFINKKHGQVIQRELKFMDQNRYDSLVVNHNPA